MVFNHSCDESIFNELAQFVPYLVQNVKINLYVQETL